VYFNLQGIPPVTVGLDRSWNRDAPTQPPSSPTLLYTISSLEDQLKAAYKLVTEGKFSDALRSFLRMLQVIPLMVVESRKEVDEVRGFQIHTEGSAFCGSYERK
jgi:coatomer protein complex subunit alpha (xenin)